MPDEIFENPRLVAIYDAFDGLRDDLDLYVSLAEEFRVKSVLDIGCGTGSLANLLAGKGYSVVGLDPAKASLKYAQRKEFADRVQWVCGDSSVLPDMQVDLAVMTGNVAQVFLTDESFESTLNNTRSALKRDGLLAFEVRDPAKKAYLNWTRERTYKKLRIAGIGAVEGWCDIRNISGELVSFDHNYIFDSGERHTSRSTLRFREKATIEASLENAGFSLLDIRDASDRPGMQWVFLAQKSRLDAARAPNDL